MSRLTAKDFAPELLELYDFYAHGKISKREFLQRSAGFAAAGLTGGAVLAALSPNYAWDQQVPANDPDITADYINYPSPRGHGKRHNAAVRQRRSRACLGTLLGVV